MFKDSGENIENIENIHNMKEIMIETRNVNVGEIVEEFNVSCKSITYILVEIFILIRFVQIVP